MEQVPIQRDAVWASECPATFQRLTNRVLDVQANYSAAYIDDVVIHSQSWEDHLSHIEAVLQVLREYGLTAKPSKCQWGANSLIYLRHEVE